MEMNIVQADKFWNAEDANKYRNNLQCKIIYQVTLKK